MISTLEPFVANASLDVARVLFLSILSWVMTVSWVDQMMFIFWRLILFSSMRMISLAP